MVTIVSSSHPGIPAGAKLVTINRHRVEDVLEYTFYNNEADQRSIVILDKGERKQILIKEHEDIGIEVEPPQYRSCENRCEFCFINGLPKGLRKELYFRDDDFRLSFLFGNFLSLTNVSDDDIKRIRRLKLSPLYISVHATETDLRIKLFKNERAAEIMSQLTRLADAGIKLHCQVVVIPGSNDGIHLHRTIRDLSSLFPAVQSIGIVPVGVSTHLNNIPSVTKAHARTLIQIVDSYHTRSKKSHGSGLVYAADELFIKAGLPVPEKEYYDDFPQYENGIGMARSFLDEVDNLKPPVHIRGRNLVLTGRAARPFLEKLKQKLLSIGALEHTAFDILTIDNTFFGKNITVAGLLTDHDLMPAIRKNKKKYDRIILPPYCVNQDRKLLDDIEIEDEQVMIAPHSIPELLPCLQ
jgi:putative radical SAM enzyme (TIGR03279 family)